MAEWDNQKQNPDHGLPSIGLESRTNWEALAGGQDVSKGMVGQGHLVAVMDVPQHGVEYKPFDTLDLYPFEPMQDPNDDLVRVMQLAQLGLGEANGSPVPVFQEMQACLDRGFRRMTSSTQVALADRRRLFAKRMSIIPAKDWLENTPKDENERRVRLRTAASVRALELGAWMARKYAVILP
ncbi:hypothetical protein PpBr36_03823 [Pyricularia pennisetigena]|uniref:hypothetical protein n=1 Tax=Pyricularia pennisetigena TaxID=1578925 RepID=UPI001150CE2D|nr:hypothetical protein PpBr36_03823 [Pyricularia pennisetigena]TLS30324.1 hypothetical protein PpBr36_03823 [Pyricularia pennisetigena]